MNKKNKHIIILFDGVCNMCVWSVRFIIKRDLNNVFKLASIQSKVGKKIIADYNIDVNKYDSIIFVKNDIIKYRSSAVLSIVYHLKTIWKFLLIFYFIPKPIRDFMYILIAKLRYVFFGKRKKCILPNELSTSKFLN
ncbi:MAG: thiol-disulfide oxidoreductase [Flavobacteriales bacterium]|nr:thiol-disulfide oxidoreductase [Flavobacteriales bacterium]|tara:strand:- start:74 stop:484 length:411 start_codon:yes stop_codon:yes gene_type:complete